MFRTVPLSTIRSFSLYTHQWYMSYMFIDSFRAGSGWNCSSILILLASCQQTCLTYTIAVCTVKSSRWWTEELSETCRVSFQNRWEISASSWFYYKDRFSQFHEGSPKLCISPHGIHMRSFWLSDKRRLFFYAQLEPIPIHNKNLIFTSRQELHLYVKFDKYFPLMF
jgi:hypothetical protein